MSSTDRLRRPFGELLGIELRTVGLALSREGLVAIALLAGICVLTALTAIRYGERLDVVPELLSASFPVALILPWVAWKGDPAFGRAVLWTLPVRRQQAAAAKVAAGAVWLMLALLLAMLALMATSLATGGTIGIEEVRVVGPYSSDLASIPRVAWATPAWSWLVPFGAALTLYVASSAALLGLRHPLRWLAGISVAVALAAVLAVNLGPDNALKDGFENILDSIVGGRFGLDFVLSGGATSLSRDIRIDDYRVVNLWTDLPSAGRWAMALAVWLGIALIALALAFRRHWER